ncbi:MAG: hypothetical protein IPN76_22365 [Saprospiraceae bacterium]|nr:hypothetical protein [Saprospiraceae bacterium]
MKKINSLPFILLLSWLLLAISGCATLLGLGIGAITDIDKKDERPVILPGWGEVSTLKPGNWVEIVKKDEQVEEGKIVKLLLTPQENGDTVRSLLIAPKNEIGQKAIDINDIDHIVLGTKSTSGAAKGLLIGAGVDIATVAIVAYTLRDFGDGWETSNGNNNNNEESDVSSCPFIYSFDGEDYRLEGEVFGGAIFEAARRTDLLNMNALKETNGHYGIKITNELEETQFVDELKLIVVDHPAGTGLYPSFDGKLHLLSSLVYPKSAQDKDGHNITSELNEKDDLVWISNPFNRDPDKLEDARDWVELTFDKPAEISKATLLCNLQNTRWGAVMQKEMLALQGDQLDAWYQSLNNSEAARKELMGLMVREGMLQIKVWTDAGWKDVGFIWEVGPAAARDAAVGIDLSAVQSTTLKMRLEFPVGFWAINAVKISYNDQSPTLVNELAPSKAVGHSGQDLMEALSQPDQKYYTMPTTSDWAHVSYKAIPLKKGFKRSFVIKSNGYYNIHMNPTGKRQDALIEHIKNTPGAYGQFTLQKLQQYKLDATNQLRTASIKNQRPNG